MLYFLFGALGAKEALKLQHQDVVLQLQLALQRTTTTLRANSRHYHETCCSSLHCSEQRTTLCEQISEEREQHGLACECDARTDLRYGLLQHEVVVALGEGAVEDLVEHALRRVRLSILLLQHQRA